MCSNGRTKYSRALHCNRFEGNLEGATQRFAFFVSLSALFVCMFILARLQKYRQAQQRKSGDPADLSSSFSAINLDSLPSEVGIEELTSRQGLFHCLIQFFLLGFTLSRRWHIPRLDHL